MESRIVFFFVVLMFFVFFLQSVNCRGGVTSQEDDKKRGPAAKNDQKILDYFEGIWEKREDRYSELRHSTKSHKNKINKVE